MPLPQNFGLDPAAAIAAAQQAADQSAARTQDALQQMGGSDTASGMNVSGGMSPIGQAATGAAAPSASGGGGSAAAASGGQGPSILGRIGFALANMGTHGAALQQRMAQQFQQKQFDAMMKAKNKAAQDQAVYESWQQVAQSGDPNMMNSPDFQKWAKINPELAGPMVEFAKTQQKLQQGKAAIGQLIAGALGQKLTPEQQNALAQDPKAAEGLLGIAGKQLDLAGKKVQEQRAEAQAKSAERIAAMREGTAGIEQNTAKVREQAAKDAAARDAAKAEAGKGSTDPQITINRRASVLNSAITDYMKLHPPSSLGKLVGGGAPDPHALNQYLITERGLDPHSGAPLGTSFSAKVPPNTQPGQLLTMGGKSAVYWDGKLYPVTP